jgi:aspartyl-tRNA(Asn)/glutamyl-tRNA(Gln) amidotransferase subunit C
MSISAEDVDKIAHLARLALEPDGVPQYAADLSNILDLVAQIQAVDTEDVAPLAHPLELTQRLRPDDVTETDQRARFQAIAPSVAAGLYLVPKVIE